MENVKKECRKCGGSINISFSKEMKKDAKETMDIFTKAHGKCQPSNQSLK